MSVIVCFTKDFQMREWINIVSYRIWIPGKELSCKNKTYGFHLQKIFSKIYKYIFSYIVIFSIWRHNGVNSDWALLWNSHGIIFELHLLFSIVVEHLFKAKMYIPTWMGQIPGKTTPYHKADTSQMPLQDLFLTCLQNMTWSNLQYSPQQT